jgi:3-oxoacyl-[acyl-carrier-protein] synthase II
MTTNVRIARDEPIVVTGMGVLCAAGDSPAALWETVAAGTSPAAWFRDSTAAGSPPIPACQVSGPIAIDALVRHAGRMDRTVQLALAAANRAILDAGLDRDRPDPTRLGVIAGTSRGPMQKWSELIGLVRDAPSRRLPPSLGANTTLACLSGALSVAFEAGGPCLTVSSACASSAHAVVVAAQQIQLGMADVMLVGGADAPLYDHMIRQIVSLGLLGSHEDPRRACRPFDVTRDGTLLGEGSGFLVLESLASAVRRRVEPHAILAGWALGSDHAHCASPTENGEGLVHVMTRSMDLAGLKPEDIDAINLHGTGTKLNDRLEAIAMRRVFGERLDEIPSSSTKPITGHCLGGSAALEAVISILALHHQAVPGTANCAELDPECAINLVRGTAVPTPLRTVMSNSLGFWGNNASLLFTQMS